MGNVLRWTWPKFSILQCSSIANLFGRNQSERAEALIAIAHPDFREEPERVAKERRLLP